MVEFAAEIVEEIEMAGEGDVSKFYPSVVDEITTAELLEAEFQPIYRSVVIVDHDTYEVLID